MRKIFFAAIYALAAVAFAQQDSMVHDSASVSVVDLDTVAGDTVAVVNLVEAENNAKTMLLRDGPLKINTDFKNEFGFKFNSLNYYFGFGYRRWLREDIGVQAAFMPSFESFRDQPGAQFTEVTIYIAGIKRISTRNLLHLDLLLGTQFYLRDDQIHSTMFAGTSRDMRVFSIYCGPGFTCNTRYFSWNFEFPLYYAVTAGDLEKDNIGMLAALSFYYRF
jgi:hypothetical protein